VASLKEQFLSKKLQQEDANFSNRAKYSTLLLSSKHHHHQHLQPKLTINTNTINKNTTAGLPFDTVNNSKLMNLELDLNDLDSSSNIMSLMMLNANGNLANSNCGPNSQSQQQQQQQQSPSASSSTPSPSSSTISSASSSNATNHSHENSSLPPTVNTELEETILNSPNLLMTSGNSSPNDPSNNLKSQHQKSQFLFDSYSSLMNMSMLDNIQATNTSLELDNMNSSILTFN
jgi:hypothetical protein